MKRKTGYYVHLHGERYWHISKALAILRAERAWYWCADAQVIEVSTGRLCYGRPA